MADPLTLARRPNLARRRFSIGPRDPR